MKKMLVFLLCVMSSAGYCSDWYGNASVDQKDKLHSKTNEFHNVVAFTIGKKLDNGWSVEGLVEEELVKNGSSGQANEGLYQLRVNKQFKTDTIFQPYMGVATGVKNKATIGFPIYRYDIGTRVKLTDSLTGRINWRHRQAFHETTDSHPTKYNTDETRLSLIYNVTKTDAVTLSYAQERNNDGLSSEYNTLGISYSKHF